jgi:DNA topoisomerase VI subunit B
MSIRLIAKDLYRLIGEVEKIENELNTALQEKRMELQDQLRKLQAERDRLRRALEGSKDI